jgi:predicted DNA-binding transcriptional regulator YafY
MSIELKRHRIKEKKMLRLFSLIRMLFKGRHTVESITQELQISERTFYRYNIMLEFMDIHTDKDFYKKYFIRKTKCPICGHTTNNTLR